MLTSLSKTVRIPVSTAGLSEPFDVRGYRIASIQVPGTWTAANITFRGAGQLQTPPTQVVPTGTAAGLSVDANAYDAEMDNAVTLQRGTARATPAKVDPIDISALLSPAATISTSKYGALWVFQKMTGSSETGVAAVETDAATAAHTSAIMALAQFSASSRALPSTESYVPIGCVQVTEGGSGAFTWGTDSITAETETYYSFAGVPEVLTRVASLALDAGAATFTYGAGTIRLGTGTLVSLSGKANVTITGSNVAAGNVGAWLLYALADDVECALQLGYAYPTLADAQAAVANHRANPLLPYFGVMYVVNGTVAAFVPGTTFLDATSIATTFVVTAPRYENVYDDNGAEVSVTAAAGRMVILGALVQEALSGMAEVQLRSGSAGTPVSQVNSPDLVVVLEF